MDNSSQLLNFLIVSDKMNYSTGFSRCQELCVAKNTEPNSYSLMCSTFHVGRDQVLNSNSWGPNVTLEDASSVFGGVGIFQVMKSDLGGLVNSNVSISNVIIANL